MSFLCSLSGCGKDDETQEVGLPFAGQTIKVAVPLDEGFETSWDVLIREWEAQNEAKVEIVEVEVDSSTSSSAEIADAYKTVKPTISFFPIKQISNFAENGLCKSLPKDELEELKLNWFDIFPGLRDKILSLGGEPTAIPTSCPTLKLFYRKDLLQAASREIPETWEQYDELAASVESWAPGLNCAEPQSSDFMLPLFFSRAFSQAKHSGNYSVLFDVYTGEPLIDSPAFVEALTRFAKHRMSVGLTDNASTPTDCLKELLEGRAAIAIATEHRSADIEISRAKDIAIGCVQLPGSFRVYNSTTKSWEQLADERVNRVPVSAFDGFCAGVSEEASDVQTVAALNLFRRLSMPIPVSGFEKGKRSLCRSSWFATAEIWMTDNLTGNEKLEILDATSDVLSNEQIQSYLPFNDADQYFADLERAVEKVLRGESEPEAALKDVSNMWGQRSKTNRTSVVNSYRSRLGLRPTTLP